MTFDVLLQPFMKQMNTDIISKTSTLFLLCWIKALSAHSGHCRAIGCRLGETVVLEEMDIRGTHQTCAKNPKRSEILDLQDPRSEILEEPGSYIFIFPWDLINPGSCHGNIAEGS